MSLLLFMGWYGLGGSRAWQPTVPRSVSVFRERHPQGRVQDLGRHNRKRRRFSILHSEGLTWMHGVKSRWDSAVASRAPLYTELRLVVGYAAGEAAPKPPSVT